MRDIFIKVYLNEEEYGIIKKRAKKEGLELSPYLRNLGIKKEKKKKERVFIIPSKNENIERIRQKRKIPIIQKSKMDLVMVEMQNIFKENGKRGLKRIKIKEFTKLELQKLEWKAARVSYDIKRKIWIKEKISLENLKPPKNVVKTLEEQ